MLPIKPCATSARGAAASHSFIEPASSASKCPNAIQRRLSIGMIRATAAETSGNILRSPQWKRSGSSSRMRNELKVKPAGGAMAGANVDSR